MTARWVKIFLIVCAVYDGVIGAISFLVPRSLFHIFAVTPPNHWGYIRFPALLLIIFAAMFLRAAADPVARRDVILYGAALKLSYCGVVFWYQFRGNVPAIWVPFAYADLVFLVLFLLAWKTTAPSAKSAA
jgi:hypothetical protein